MKAICAVSLLMWVVSYAVVLPAHAQTIPELLAEAKESLGRSVEIETGPPLSIDAVLRETDVIVRGTVGNPQTYLSDDQMDVYSDYPIVNPAFLYPHSAAAASIPGNAVVVTHIGGTITIDGYSFTMHHSELPPFTPGMEALFLLKRDGAKYRIAGTYYGVFRTDTPALIPLAGAQGFGRSYRRLRRDDAIRDIVARAQAQLHRP